MRPTLAAHFRVHDSCDVARRYKVSTGFVTFGMQLSLKQARGEKVTQAELDDYAWDRCWPGPSSSPRTG